MNFKGLPENLYAGKINNLTPNSPNIYTLSNNLTEEPYA